MAGKTHCFTSNFFAYTAISKVRGPVLQRQPSIQERLYRNPYEYQPVLP